MKISIFGRIIYCLNNRNAEEKNGITAFNSTFMACNVSKFEIIPYTRFFSRCTKIAGILVKMLFENLSFSMQDTEKSMNMSVVFKFYQIFFVWGYTITCYFSHLFRPLVTNCDPFLNVLEAVYWYNKKLLRNSTLKKSM